MQLMIVDVRGSIDPIHSLQPLVQRHMRGFQDRLRKDRELLSAVTAFF